MFAPSEVESARLRRVSSSVRARSHPVRKFACRAGLTASCPERRGVSHREASSHTPTPRLENLPPRHSRREVNSRLASLRGATGSANRIPRMVEVFEKRGGPCGLAPRRASSRPCNVIGNLSLAGEDYVTTQTRRDAKLDCSPEHPVAAVGLDHHDTCHHKTRWGNARIPRWYCPDAHKIWSLLLRGSTIRHAGRA